MERGSLLGANRDGPGITSDFAYHHSTIRRDIVGGFFLSK
jgi:hypothetical protein